MLLHNHARLTQGADHRRWRGRGSWAPGAGLGTVFFCALRMQMRFGPSNLEQLCRGANQQWPVQPHHYYYSYLADAFIRNTLLLIRLSRGQFPLEQCGVTIKGPTAV